MDTTETTSTRRLIIAGALVTGTPLLFAVFGSALGWALALLLWDDPGYGVLLGAGVVGALGLVVGAIVGVTYGARVSGERSWCVQALVLAAVGFVVVGVVGLPLLPTGFLVLIACTFVPLVRRRRSSGR